MRIGFLSAEVFHFFKASSMSREIIIDICYFTMLSSEKCIKTTLIGICDCKITLFFFDYQSFLKGLNTLGGFYLSLPALICLFSSFVLWYTGLVPCAEWYHPFWGVLAGNPWGIFLAYGVEDSC